MNAPLPAVDQDKTDAEHLRLLSIFHYVCAAFLGMVALFPIIHLIMGIAIVAGWLPAEPGTDSPEVLGWIFIGVAATIMLIGFTMAFAVFLAGRKLKAHTGHTFCMVVAGFLCLFMPLGTVLGVFTILVLNRPSVRALFGRPGTA